MKEQIKKYLRNIPDISIYKIFEFVFLSFSNKHRLFRSSNKIGNKIAKLSQNRVISGPFEGMQYIEVAHGSMLAPKLLGSYEAEIHNALEEIIHLKKYSRVINIGCGEGYYAVGLAKRIPDSIVFAYDIDLSATNSCLALANANKVSGRVFVTTECTSDSLNLTIDPKSTLIVCDCEGCEFELLDPKLSSKLLSCDFIVETHDFNNPLITSTLIERFHDTHTIDFIDISARDPSKYPVLKKFSDKEIALALNEFRGSKQQWAIMKVK